MEIEILYIIVSLIAGSIIITRIIVTKNSPKKAVRDLSNMNDKAILDHYKVLMTINDDQKTTIRSIRGKLSRLEALEDQEDEEEVDPQELIKQSMPMIQAAAKQFGLAPEKLQVLLSNPQVQEWISNPKNLKKLKEYAPILQAMGSNNQTAQSGASVPSDYA